MKNQNYSISFAVDQSPEQVFNAINNVRGWWSGEIEGEADKLGAEFTYRYQNMHRSKQKITDLIPNKKVVWHVLDSSLSFLKTKANGLVPTLSLMSSQKTAKRKSVLPM